MKGKAVQNNADLATAIPPLSRLGWVTSDEFSNPSENLEEEVKGCFEQLESKHASSQQEYRASANNFLLSKQTFLQHISSTSRI